MPALMWTTVPPAKSIGATVAAPSVTPSEMLGARYDSRLLAGLIAVLSCIFLIPYSAVQLLGTRDRVFPPSHRTIDYRIRGGGHFMVLSHAAEIAGILNGLDLG